jgi:hypothetical protein
VAVTSRNRDDDADREAPPVPWHNRTSTLLGASVAGVAAIAILITSISYVSRQFNEPQQAPLNYVEPAFSATSTSESSTSTTTGTITSTSPPITSDINPDLTPSSSTDPSATTSRNPASRPPRTREDDEPSTRTTRNRPRTNVTRTFYPAP